jgi:hypothetical protein
LDKIILLGAISSTDPISFREFCGALEHNKPEDTQEWREMFAILREVEAEGLVEIDRATANGDIDSLILTEAGAAHLRAARRR